MIDILHYLKDPKLWEVRYTPYYMGNAGFISSTVVLSSGILADTKPLRIEVNNSQALEPVAHCQAIKLLEAELHINSPKQTTLKP